MAREIKKKTGKTAFVINEKKLVYDYNKLTIVQAESALEILRFKNDMDSIKPESFFHVKRAGGHTWRSQVLAYLVSEEIDSKLKVFTEGDEEKNVLLIRQLQGEANYKKMEDCINDFFTNKGMLKSLSAAKHSQHEIDLKEKFVQTLVGTMMNFKNMNDTKSETSPFKKSGTKAK